VGNPVREEIAALAAHPYTPPTDIVQLLVLGGSLGAQVFSKIVPAAFATIAPEARLRFRISQQCRPEDIDAVRAARAREDEAFAVRVGSPENVEAITAFLQKREPDFSNVDPE